MADERLERILAALRAEGGRSTVQRRVVIGALLDSPRHTTAEELAAIVQARHPDIATSTIYRTLESLERQGIVQHAHLGHGPAVYHVIDDDHLHLVCETCHAVIEVPARSYASLARALDRDYGFQIDVHHFAVLGSCAACRAVAARDSR